MNVGNQIRRAVKRFGPMIAAICGDESRSFEEIDERSNQLANGLLASGMSKGDRVAVLLENSIRCVEIDFALAKAGLVRVSLNPRSTAKDVAYVIEDSQAAAVIFADGFAATLPPLGGEGASALLELCVNEGDRTGAPGMPAAADYEAFLAGSDKRVIDTETDPEDLYCLFYTSGTTGRPKGVMLSHRAILHVSYNLLMEIGPQSPGEKILLMQPMSHGAGFFVLPWFMRGGASVIMRHFDPKDVIALADRYEIETIKLVPTMLQRILKCDPLDFRELPKLRYIVYGASPMPVEVTRKAIAQFGVRFVQIYGQSEAPVTLSILQKCDHDPVDGKAERLGSAGVPFETVEMRIVDQSGNAVPTGEPGEVVLRAPQLMLGYWNRPEQTAETVRSGWLYTRDLGRFDENGYLYLLGRMDEMIISGGYNIAPREVEEVIYLHPAIQEVAVVGEPDVEWGNAVVAYVSLRHHVDETELSDFAKTHLGFKRPKRFYRLNELPKNPNGKIQKSELRPDGALSWETAVQ